MSSYADISLPKLQAFGATGIAPTSSEASISLPLLEILAESFSTHSEAGITLPALIISANCLSTSSSALLVLPKISINARCFATNSVANISLRLLKATASSYNGSGSSALITLPKLRIISSSNTITTSSATIVLPKLVIEALSGVNSYLCLVLHNEVAPTTWSFASNIDSMVELDGEIYLASASGLFLLGGVNDNGTAISATIQTGLDDGGIPYMKQATGYYLGMRSNGTLQLSMSGEDESEADNNLHTIKTTANKVRTRRVMTERNPRGRWLGAKVSNVDGADFRIVGISISSKILYRKDNTNA